MNTTTKTQKRGICQVCGREQAIVGGLMSKHGYTVKGGWFQGICGGQRHKPLNVERTVTDRTVKAVRDEAAELRITAKEMEAGTINPKITKRTWNNTKGDYDVTEVPYADAPKWDQDEARRSAAWNLNRRAEMGESYGDQMEALADSVHGTPVRIVPVESGPAPILCGERRFSESSHDVMTVVDVRGPRVYWTMARGTEGKVYKGWTGTQAFRKLPLVA